MKPDIEKLRELEKIPEFRQKWEIQLDGRKFADGSPVAHIKLLGEGYVMIAYTLPIEVANGIVSLYDALPDLLTELETLRAIVQELVRSEPTYARGLCIFCDKRDGHEADCLIERAKEAIR